MSYTVKLCRGLDDIPEARYIREAVFVKEQGFTKEFDEKDGFAFHAVISDGDKPVATGRLFRENGGFVIGRIAVLKEYRGKSVGSLVVGVLEREAQRQGAVEVSLAAQLRARGFYERLGYKSREDIHMDEFCPHVTMTKRLK
ncbi:GNAT family N-acetyltransferase [Ruminococcus sp. Marseille-P6503]|uniref:GNAT family N-acetyltransferase n=1 Tax=Ruminococcus sp. Marseille-P6503 TaxID=2364796 RepID=UPI0013DDBA23|nr:GNAT family N-acetyltransferase [Ruminococcus sp. Marseille-P6503]